MTIPADSLPGDHLRAEELLEMRAALCHFLRKQSAPMSDHSILSQKLEQCLCANVKDAVCLKSKELKTMRKQLCSLMQTEKSSPAASLLERFFERLSLLSQSTFPRVIAGCCVLLILGNSVALAATQTVPGDTLYPVKINLLEPAQALVTITPAGKAAWASTCVHRRLAEAERLIAQNRLTPEAWTTISTSIAANTNAAERHILTLSKANASEAADLSANLHLTLNAHGKVFADVARLSDQPAVSTAASDISSIAATTTDLYTQTQNIAAQDQEGIQRTAMHVIESAASAAAMLTDTGSKNLLPTSNSARGRANDVKQLLQHAKDQLKAGQFADSLHDVRMAQQKTEEGKAYVRLGQKFDRAGSESGDDMKVMAVPLSVCGASVLHVSVPAIAAPLARPSVSSKSDRKHHESSSDQKNELPLGSSISSSVRSSLSSVEVSSAQSASVSQKTSVTSSSSEVDLENIIQKISHEH